MAPPGLLLFCWQLRLAIKKKPVYVICVSDCLSVSVNRIHNQPTHRQAAIRSIFYYYLFHNLNKRKRKEGVISFIWWYLCRYFTFNNKSIHKATAAG